MDIRPIRTDADHARALGFIDELWGAEPGTSQADDLEVLLALVDAFESKHHAIDPPDPIDAIVFRMEQQGLSRRDLEPLIGHRGRVSEILGRKRALTLKMIRRLHTELGIPAEILLGEVQDEAA